jgi:hypothetical protein
MPPIKLENGPLFGWWILERTGSHLSPAKNTPLSKADADENSGNIWPRFGQKFISGLISL